MGRLKYPALHRLTVLVAYPVNLIRRHRLYRLKVREVESHSQGCRERIGSDGLVHLAELAAHDLADLVSPMSEGERVNLGCLVGDKLDLVVGNIGELLTDLPRDTLDLLAGRVALAFCESSHRLAERLFRPFQITGIKSLSELFLDLIAEDGAAV